jgi:mannose-1-phosphate guanylyltransferase
MAAITQAFVLAAGKGTRLRPLTENLPKPLIPIFQKPLITFAFDHLIDTGVKSLIVNTHRLPEAFTGVFAENWYENSSLKFVNEPILLGTGGGIKNVEPLLGNKPFIAYSGDILTDINLEPLIKNHFDGRNAVTLGLRSNTGLGAGVVMRNGRVLAISNQSNPVENFDYANVSVWNPEIFPRIPPKQEASFIPIVANWIGQGGRIGGVILDDGQWFNIGSRAEYLKVHRKIWNEGWRPHYVKMPGWPERIAKSARIEPSAQLLGCSAVGEDCYVGEEAILEDTILWPGAQIASKSDLRGCIVRSQKRVSGTHRNVDI